MSVIGDLILKNRSYRRFDPSYPINRETLIELVELARLSPSGGNLQALKFMLSHDPLTNSKVIECLSWAGYLKDWPGPLPDERPVAYIVILGDKSIRESIKVDQGIAAQSMLLGATEKGLGGCIIGSVKHEKLRENLNIQSHLEILLVLALGKPAEEIQIEDATIVGNIKYWRDKAGVHHVPKRNLDDLIIS